MKSVDWVCGVLFGFSAINERRNVSSDFEFVELIGTENSLHLLQRHLEKQTQDVELFAKRIENPREVENELAGSLHRWLFVLFGVTNTVKNKEEPRLIDQDDFFDMSKKESQIQFSKDFLKEILAVAEPERVYNVRIQARDGYFSFGRHFLLESEKTVFWLRLGEVF